MIKMKKEEFLRKKKAWGSFFFYTFLGPTFIAFGLYCYSKLSKQGPIGREQFWIIILGGLALTIFGLTKALFLFREVMSDNSLENGIFSDHFICINCLEPFSSQQLDELRCPKCSGDLEPLSGFYDRHPNLREEKK